MSLINTQKLTKKYNLGQIQVPALRSVSLSIESGTLTALCGQSGSGKTTLLNLIGCVDRPESGSLTIDGQEVTGLSDDDLSDFRAQKLGYVFQNFNLLPVFTAYENVEFPLTLLKRPPHERKKRVADLIAAVGLADKMHRRPSEMSGGQRQRVAIARALAASPRLVLADEPTANLDSETARDIIQLMRKMQKDCQTTFLITSHDPLIQQEADATIHIKDGQLVDGPQG